MSRLEDLRDGLRLLRLSARSLAGRWFWFLPLAPLAWPGFLILRLAVGWRDEGYAVWQAQGVIALPLTVLAILLGVRIIAGELDARTLEIAYTVPGGTHRLWLAKFAAAVLILVAAEALLGVLVWLVLTDFPLGALYGALQGAVFYLAVAMALAALFKSEVAGVMITILVWIVLATLSTAFGQPTGQVRASPFWNPAGPSFAEYDRADVVAWTVQNRIGFVLVIAAVVLLALVRAERREKLLQ